MMQSLVAAIQMNSTDEVAENLRVAGQYLHEAASAGAALAVLPENFSWMGHEADSAQTAERFGSGPVQDFLAETSARLGIWIIAGSLKLTTGRGDKVTNTLLVYDEKGRRAARYDKIHLFDAQVADGEGYRESDTIEAGSSIALADTPCGRVGLSICYDLRFPHLYQTLTAKGAELMVVPAAFTYTTGQAHWEVLLRARAIENQVYIVAAAQTGRHANGRDTWGHAAIIDPWGKVLADAGSQPGVILAEVNAEQLASLRKDMPVAQHQRAAAYS